MGLIVLKDRLIVCLASSWDYDPTSKHHIAKILSQDNQVIWVNYHGSRKPTINKFDISASISALKRVAGGIQRVSESLVQVTPMVIPGAKHPHVQKLHQWMLIAQIRRAIRKVRGTNNTPVQVWTFAPDVPYLVGKFKEECFLYYCVDEYTQFEGFDTQQIARSENELLEKSDIVVTSSQKLHQTKSKIRPDNVLIRHGVDYDHFSSAWQSQLKTPDDIQHLKKPVFGFFGLVHHWIDRSLLANIARLRPQYNFVVIGDCKVDVSMLRDLPNVHLIGRRPYDTLPAYCAAFDAGMLLFTRTAMTQNINPIKMLEYLAAGLPVISTPLPEAQRYRGPINIVETAEQFALACDNVVGRDDPANRRMISQIVTGETWRTKVDILTETIMKRMKLPGRTASMPARIVTTSPVVTSGWQQHKTRIEQ